jgi:hypothetical protein
MSIVRKLIAEGFRAFADRKEFDLSVGSRAVNVCIFGENGTGKSSIADAIEFLTSEKGTVERLGEKPSENQAGNAALLHRGTAKKNRPGKVTVECCDGRTLARAVSTLAKPEKLPTDIAGVVTVAPVPFLLRFTEMRRFVADRKGKERYEQLARWIGLERLTEIQDALTAIEGKLQKTNRAEAKEEHARALTKLTTGVVKTWNEVDVCTWLNEVRLSPTTVRVKSAKELEQVAKDLADLRAAEEQRASVDNIRDYRADVKSFVESDAAARYENAAIVYGQAVEYEQATRSAIDVAPLREVWRTTRAFLGASNALSCPSCFRDFDENTTRTAVLDRLDASLAQLESVEKAEAARKDARSTLLSSVRALDKTARGVPAAPAALAPDAQVFDSRLSVLRDSAEAWLATTADAQISVPSFAGAIEEAHRAGDELVARCERWIEEAAQRTIPPFEEIDVGIKRLIEIRDDWSRLVRQETELNRALEQYRAVADVIRKRIHEHITKVLGDLEADVCAIYAVLRKNDADVPVISVRVDEKSMSLVLDLFGEKEMIPSSYLSDSQLNSLGLALYIASVRKFNRAFAFIVLDDIMSSYDAGHRLNLIEVIRDFLADFQIVLTTHDEPFYRQVRAMLNGKNGWKFYRLLPYNFQIGLRFRHDAATAEELKRRIDEGESTDVLAQIVMADLETRLLAVIAKRNETVKIPIKKDLSPGEATMGTLWAAAQACFDEEDRKYSSYSFVAGHALLNWPRHGATQATMSITATEIATFFDHVEKFFSQHAERKGK